MWSIPWISVLEKISPSKQLIFLTHGINVWVWRQVNSVLKFIPTTTVFIVHMNVFIIYFWCKVWFDTLTQKLKVWFDLQVQGNMLYMCWVIRGRQSGDTTYEHTKWIPTHIILPLLYPVFLPQLQVNIYPHPKGVCYWLVSFFFTNWSPLGTTTMESEEDYFYSRSLGFRSTLDLCFRSSGSRDSDCAREWERDPDCSSF